MMRLQHIYAWIAALTLLMNIAVVFKLMACLHGDKAAYAETRETVKIFRISRTKPSKQTATLTMVEEDVTI